MKKHKLWVVAGLPILALLLVGAGFAAGKGAFKHNPYRINEYGVASATAAGSTSSLSSGGQDVDSSNSLSVSGSSNAMDLGQLGGNSSGGSNGAQSSSSSGSSSQDIDPSTFAQYEKYKDQQHALFGDALKGTGAQAEPNKQVAIYYKGWLTNGKMFDQSPSHGGQREPLIFTEGAHTVVQGMEEGVLGMKVGGKRLIIIPPAVGYGSKAQGPIPANSVMIFEVELVTVQ